MTPKKIRCAVYTRKSTEEGLEQDFNTLDAQRSACEAYIKSQAGEGWTLVPERFEDGGFSGGDMDRPALGALLKEIDRGRIDVVVVYKVDRLTRSLTDFAKIVDVLDGANASFVSVTQAFNTTTSMGRLTLNVLLSFAQFEREVTGERIRDKIAASKARGMWMGGNPPLGYDANERQLVVNDGEAAQVRALFDAYLRLGGVPSVARWAEAEGLRSKRRVSAKGGVRGGKVMKPGQIYHILENRIYVGEIEHRSQIYKGNHRAIVSRHIFEDVQKRIEAARQAPRTKLTRAAKCPLAGKVFDAAGAEMAASFSYGRGRKIYRYYVSRSQLPYGFTNQDGQQRISAERLERSIAAEIRRICGKDAGFEQVVRVELTSSEILVELERADGSSVKSRVDPGPLRRGRTIGCDLPVDDIERKQAMAELLTTAHRRMETMGASPLSSDLHANAIAPTNEWTRSRMAIPFLAPDIQKAILRGDVPAALSVSSLLDRTLPLAWEDQRQRLGFA
ncbi:hypothetical protein B5C34_13540 [Pacificimonas flava]|uniref:Resolvase n=2 Tax=Pacificimonas TaxID=1960290 RepID=A0A219B7L8_9SPHN|nr:MULTISPECIES: recombinase family protein [Pacificimonas]MBZ6379847.1 recombinase family protein [Pacificimonas aurantium]OWV34380.1 hypothetical protein B5C34_13540 [Pacificimonas flava]